MSKAFLRLFIALIVLVVLIGLFVSLFPSEEHYHSIRTRTSTDKSTRCLVHQFSECQTCDYVVFYKDYYVHEYVDGICIFCDSKNPNTDCLHLNAWLPSGDSESGSCMQYYFDWYCPDCREYGGYQEYCKSDNGHDGLPCTCSRKKCTCEEYN